MAQDYLAERGIDPGQPPGTSNSSSIFDPPEVTNNSGSAVDAYTVLGISGVAITQTQNDSLYKTKIQFTGGTPATGDDFVIALAPINASSIGVCCAWGITPAYVNMTNADDGWADVKNGDATQLQSSSVSGAAEILYTPGGTGKQLCIVRIGNFSQVEEIQVDLTQDNGAGHEGGPTTAASFTYTPTDLSGNPVKDASGTTLTAMAPTHNRRIGFTTAATQGVLVFKPDGTVALRWTDEVAGTVERSCP